MRQLLKITFIILATTVAFTACRGNEEDIIPSGNYSPIRTISGGVNITF